MILSFFTDLFQQEFLLRALLAGLMLGILAPLLGSIVVVRRLSFIADTLGHFSLVGISFSLFMSSIGFVTFFEKEFYIGIVFSIIGGLLIEFFRRSYKNYKEISMVIVISLGAALSAIFFALASATGSLYEYLFGSILTINDESFYLILITLFIVSIVFVIFGKKIIAVSFDEMNAKFMGINVGMFQWVFIVMLSIVVSVLLEAAGVLLISSLMVIPVAAAMRVGWSFKATVIISVIFSELSVLIGLWMTYSLNIPSGASIVSINIIILLIVALTKRISNSRRIKKTSSISS
ncbi:MAG TPA: metal ABC transporter permease [Candidatus Izemoplasmatales bacterium]|nr:metal ABC transporter permease [Candidatus Izemoplasmatales bacterium]